MKIKLMKINKAMVLGLVMAGIAGWFAFGYQPQQWWKADRSSVGLAPLPAEEKGAVVQVYAARTFNWRGYFSVHSWIAAKEKDSDHYLIYQVLGYRLFRGGHAVSVEKDIPDRKWFGAEPHLIEDLRGEAAEKAIVRLNQLVKEYPYDQVYRIWPGPNSNTFISFLIRHIPELTVELPPNAIGKDWLENHRFFARSESGSGFQFSFFGLFGITIGLAEGLEINILGLNFGIDLWRPALKLPFVGRIGVKDAPLH